MTKPSINRSGTARNNHDEHTDNDADDVGWSADTVTLDGAEYTVDELAEWKYQQIADGDGEVKA